MPIVVDWADRIVIHVTVYQTINHYMQARGTQIQSILTVEWSQ